MTITALKERVQNYRASLADKSGKAVMFSESGPASMDLINALVATVERQQKEIDELRKSALRTAQLS